MFLADSQIYPSYMNANEKKSVFSLQASLRGLHFFTSILLEWGID
jgi:hypothetical protein